jgi:hypothetical protein
MTVTDHVARPSVRGTLVLTVTANLQFLNQPGVWRVAFIGKKQILVFLDLQGFQRLSVRRPPDTYGSLAGATANGHQPQLSTTPRSSMPRNRRATAVTARRLVFCISCYDIVPTFILGLGTLLRATALIIDHP